MQKLLIKSSINAVMFKMLITLSSTLFMRLGSAESCCSLFSLMCLTRLLTSWTRSLDSLHAPPLSSPLTLGSDSSRLDDSLHATPGPAASCSSASSAALNPLASGCRHAESRSMAASSTVRSKTSRTFISKATTLCPKSSCSTLECLL